MQVQRALPARSILLHHNPDNLLLIENVAGNVIIHAVRDNFSPRRKAFFIRHLAAEGYIPDRFERLYHSGSDAFATVRWIIDPACLRPKISSRRQSNRFMVRLIIGAVVLWHALIAFAFLRSAY